LCSPRAARDNTQPGPAVGAEPCRELGEHSLVTPCQPATTDTSHPCGLPPQDAFSILLASADSPASLADRLEAALPLAANNAAISQLQTAAGIRLLIQTLNLPGLAADLQAAEQDLAAQQASLGSVLSSMDDYVSTYGSGGGMPLASWAALVGGVQGAGSAVGTTLGQVPTTSGLFNQVGSTGGLKGCREGWLKAEQWAYPWDYLNCMDSSACLQSASAHAPAWC